MLIFLYGQDSFRSSNKLKEIIGQYQKKSLHGLNLKIFDLEKDVFADFKNHWQTRPIFSEKKLFVLKNAFSSEDFKKNFLKQQESFLVSEHILLFHERGKIRKNDSLFVFLKKNATVQSFETLKGKALANWVEKQFCQLDIKIETEALQLLIDSVGDDSWQMANEIKKLANYTLTAKKVRKEDVLLLVRPRVEPQIFATIEMVARKKKREAVHLIENHLENGGHPLYLLNMINFQFRHLLLVKEHLAQKKPAWRLPWFSRKMVPIATSFSFEELKKIYQQIAMIDLKIKKGQIDSKLALFVLLAKI